MKMQTNQPHILLLTLLILLSNTQALSPLPAPKHSPAPAPKHSPAPAPKHSPAPAPKRSPAPAPNLSPAAAPPLPPSPAFSGPDCTSAFLNLTSCLTFVEQGSNLTLPEKGCCPSLAGLVDSNPICLCKLLSTSDTFGIKIDDTKALALPTICRIQTPPVSLCNDLGIPVSSPGALSPGGGGAAVPSGIGPLSPGSSIAAAPSDGGDGSSTAIFTYALLAIISIVMIILF